MTFLNRIVETGEADPKKLLPNPKNWRKHPDNQAEAMTGVLDEIGWIQDVIVNRRTGRMIDGHLRVEIAIKNKEPKVPVSYVDLSEEEEEKAILTFDPLGAMAEADKKLLEELLGSVSSDSEAVNKMMDDLARENKIEKSQEVVEDDFVPPDVIETDIQRGDLILLGRHRLLCGDSTSAEDVGRLMDGKKADLLLTDPPYGINIVNTGRVGIDAPAGFGKVGTRRMVKARTYHNIEGDDHPFDPRPFLDLAPVVMLFGGNNFASRLPDSPAWLVWDKKAEKGADHNNFSDVELVWTNLKQKSCPIYRHLWSGLLREGDRNVELKDRVHPTQKPVGLIAAILSDHSNPGALCLDPFLGSGTTLIACEQLGRTCYGMEISPQYCEVICQRWEKLLNSKREVIR
jgi:16S rRNA G966 N2-methylase RsmD